MIIVLCLMWDKEPSHLDPQMRRRPFMLPAACHCFTLLYFYFRLFLVKILYNIQPVQIHHYFSRYSS